MTKLRQTLKAFGTDRRGNVGLIFALALLPMLGFVGLAVDYSRAALTKSRLQSALDQTALKLVRDGSKASQAQLETMAASFFRATYDSSDALSTGSLSVSRDQTRIRVASTATVQPAIMNLFNQPPIEIAAASAGAYDDTKIELVLVLDNTGSMATNNKMTELKRAAKNLIDQVEALNPVGDQFRVSIVPFDTRVKLSTTFRNNTNFIKYPTGGAYLAGTQFTTAAAWTGCVADRDDKDQNNVTVNYDVKGAAPTSLLPATLYPAVACPGSTMPAAAPLGTDWNALRGVVNAMAPNGNTNITIGFHWGMQMLSNGATPLSLGAPSGAANVKKFMVFLTDGDNTVNRWVSSQAPIDAKTRAICSEIKATTAIQIFTVGVLTNDGANLLHTCASTPGNYYSVQNAAQISDVFNTIFRQISQVRLSS